MQEILKEIDEKVELLNKNLNEVRACGVDRAYKEKIYRVAQKKKILELRAQNIPVTIISDMTRGDELVSQKRLDRDIAEVHYQTAIEALRVTKIELQLLNNQAQAVRKGE